MRYRIPPYIDMSIDGRIIRSRGASWPMRIAGIALIVAIVAGAIGLVALALWIAMVIAAILLPLAVLAACIAWIAYRFQMWRGGTSARSPRDLYRP